MSSRAWGVLLVLVAALAGCSGGGSGGGNASTAGTPVAPQFWVAPDGRDGGAGTSDDPFATLERARDAVRALDASRFTGDVTIFVRGGLYRLARPLALDARDSGRNGFDVVYRSAPGEQPVLSGAIPVQGWSVADPSKGIFQATVGAVRSRQLYVDGVRAVRARTTANPAGFRPDFRWNGGTPDPRGIEYIPSLLNPADWRDPNAWTNKEEIEAVVITQWRQMSVRLDSVLAWPGYQPDPATKPLLFTGLIRVREPGWTNANIYLPQDPSPEPQPGLWAFWQVTRFENAYEFLDEPGEFYLNERTGVLYYKPLPGQDMASARVELPLLEALVDGQGQLEAPLSHLRFEGLTFTGATWLGPSSDDGYVSDQSGFHVKGSGHVTNTTGHERYVTRTPGNVRFEFAHDIVIRGNIFEHLGGVALDFGLGSQGNTIRDNLFEDISSAAVQLGGVGDESHHPDRPELLVRDNAITNNLIRRTGRDFVDTAGIMVGFTTRTLISHNTIVDVPWSGIAMGWGWGLFDPGMFPGLGTAVRGMWGTYTTPTPNSGNQVLRNRIDGFLQEIWDGGAIYTTGQQGTSVDDPLRLEGNVATNKRPLGGGNVYYSDGGSRYVVLRNNVSFANPPGITDFGPPPNPADPLPYPAYWLLTGFPYGTDRGGCRTYGQIDYIENYWQFPTFTAPCPFTEDGISYPVDVRDVNNHLITGPDDFPQGLVDAAGVQARAAGIPASRWVLP